MLDTVQCDHNENWSHSTEKSLNYSLKTELDQYTCATGGASPGNGSFLLVVMIVYRKFSKTKYGNHYIVVILEGLCKKIWAVAMTMITVMHVTSIFFNQKITLILMPAYICLYSCTCFIQNFFQAVGRFSGAEHPITAAQYPQTSNRDERCNKTVISPYCSYTHKQNWPRTPLHRSWSTSTTHRYTDCLVMST